MCGCNCFNREDMSAHAYDVFFKSNPFAMLLIDVGSLMIVDANDQACRLYQYQCEEMTKLRISDIIMLPKEEIILKIGMAVLQTDNTFYWKSRIASGDFIDMEIHSGIIEMDRKIYLHFTLQKLTDFQLVQAQKELFCMKKNEFRDVERRMDYLLNRTDTILFQVDRNGFYTQFKGGSSIPKMDPAKIIGQSIFEIHKENVQGISNIKKALSGKRFRSEVSHNGYIHDVMYSPIRDFNNNIVGAYGIAVNITEKRKNEMELAESEKRYRDLYNHMELGYSCYEIVTDENNQPLDYIFVEMNPAYEILTGLVRENLIGKKATEIFPDIKKSKVNWIGLFGMVALTGKSVSMEVYSDIMDRWYSVNYFCPKSGYVSSVFSDITERVKMENELKKQKELLRIIIENIPDPLSIYDKEDHLILMNRAWRDMNEGREIKEILLHLEMPYEFFSLDGRSISLQDMPSRRALRGETVTGEIVVVKMPDREKFMSISAAPIFDEEHNVSHYVAIHRDVTERFKRENLIKSQHLKIIEVEKEKNATLHSALQMKDEFISLISHELRTPLTIITATLQTLELVCKDELSDRTARYLQKIKHNTNRQIKLINNLLDNTRLSSGHFKINRRNIDVIVLTQKILDSISTFAEKKGISVLFHTSLASKVIGIDDELYERVILNLLSNAIKFTPGNMAKSIKVTAEEETFHRKEMVKIQIIDCGIGIPKDKRDLIFEKFGQVNNIFSRSEEGTGIGLSLVKSFVGLMGGEITLHSREGHGSTFTILLPADKVDSSEENNIGDNIQERIFQSVAIEFSDI